MRGVVLLLAAGEGTRMGHERPKAFLELDGEVMLRRAARAADQAELVDALVVAAPAGSESEVEDQLRGLTKPVQVVTGGETRQSSAAACLAQAKDAEAVLVHDAARPLAPSSLFDACLRELDGCEAVCPALPIKDTIKETSGQDVSRTLDRSVMAAVQTPQGFRTEVYEKAHAAARRDHFVGTDDASLVERIGIAVRIIPGDDRNIKVTTPHDRDVAEALLRVRR